MCVPLIDGRLSEPETARYWEDGYLFPIQAITPEKARAWRSELEAIEHDWLDAGLPLPLNTYKRVNANCVLPLAHRIGTDPAILDVVEGILGPDLLIYGVEFFIKEPKTRHKVSMHQDLTYWGLGAIDGMVTMWLALSPPPALRAAWISCAPATSTRSCRMTTPSPKTTSCPAARR